MVRILPKPEGGRVETGAIQFGEFAWPSLHIRGDDAMALALNISMVVKHFETHPEPDLLFAVNDLKCLRDSILTDVIIGGKEI